LWHHQGYLSHLSWGHKPVPLLGVGLLSLESLFQTW
jgi:hypothetical protein